MITKTGAIDLYKQLTNNSETANETLGLTLVNEGIRYMMGDIGWPFLEKSTTIDTVDGQQFYGIPADAARVRNATIDVGTYRYRPDQLYSQDSWDQMNATIGVEADDPSYFYVFNDQIGFWPIPSTSGNTIRVNYLRQVRDLSEDDYTTGTITSIANGATTVTGSGTTWTAGMVGKYIRITHGNAANTGDGIWYPIESVTSTTVLELGRPYSGVAITAGSANYTIGDAMIIPENYQLGPIYFAASEYWRMNNDAGRADRFQQKYELLMNQMREDVGRKTTDPVIDDGIDDIYINPNLDPTVT